MLRERVLLRCAPRVRPTALFSVHLFPGAAPSAAPLRPTRALRYRNLLEHTLSDTPSGYLQDPANHPRRMVAYARVSRPREAAPPAPAPLAPPAFDGFATPRVAAARAVVLASESPPSRLAEAVRDLAEELPRLRADGGEAGRVGPTLRDVNHVRYLLGVGHRRLSDFARAEAALRAVLDTDLGNADAIESLLEMYGGMRDGRRIQTLLEFLSHNYTTADAEDEEEEKGEAGEGRRALAPTTAAPASPPEDALSERTPPGEHAPAPEDALSSEEPARPALTPVELALTLLADMIVEAAARYCAEHGEGATSRFFLAELEPFARHLERGFFGRLLEALFRSIDEQHYLARFANAAAGSSGEGPVGIPSVHLSPDAIQLVYSLVIAFLKTLLVRRLDELVGDPLRFRFFALAKLHAALRGAGRKHDSYTFAEQLFQLYRANSGLYRQRMAAAAARARSQAGQEGEKGEGGAEAKETEAETEQGVSVDVGALDDQDANYQAVLFDYLHDRARDPAGGGPGVARRLCLTVLDEFPRAAAPWETLAMLFYHAKEGRGMREALTAAHRGLALEPLRQSLLLVAVGLHGEAGHAALSARLLDRYRLLEAMLEAGVRGAELQAVADDIRELAETHPDTWQDEADEMKE